MDKDSKKSSEKKDDDKKSPTKEGIKQQEAKIKEKSNVDEIHLKYKLNKNSPVKSVNLLVDLEIDQNSAPKQQQRSPSPVTPPRRQPYDYYSDKPIQPKVLSFPDEFGGYRTPANRRNIVFCDVNLLPEEPIVSKEYLEDPIIKRAVDGFLEEFNQKQEKLMNSSPFRHPEKSRIRSEKEGSVGPEDILSPLTSPVNRKYKEHKKFGRLRKPNEFGEIPYKLYKIDFQLDEQPLIKEKIDERIEATGSNRLIIDRVLFTNDQRSNTMYTLIKAIQNIRTELLENFLAEKRTRHYSYMLDAYLRKIILTLKEAFRDYSPLRLVALVTICDNKEGLDNINSWWGLASSIQAYYDSETDAEVHHQIYYQCLGFSGFISIFYIQ